VANPEHLEILKQGVEVWNQWRKKKPNIETDLREAILQGVNLHKGMFLNAEHWSAHSMAFMHEARIVLRLCARPVNYSVMRLNCMNF
jgi:hypothetical protein